MQAMKNKDIRYRNVRTLVEQTGGISAFADKIGKGQSQVSQFAGENPIKGIGEKVANEIEAAFSLPSGWLDVNRSTEVREQAAHYGVLEPGPLLGAYQQVPVVGNAQLGPEGYWVAMDYPVGHGDGYLDVPKRDPGAYALRVRGDSMAPAIRNGWFVVVEPNTAPTPGDLVVICDESGRCMVKEFLYERSGDVTLGSINQDYKPLTIPLEQVTRMHFVGGILPPGKLRPA